MERFYVGTGSFRGAGVEVYERIWLGVRWFVVLVQLSFVLCIGDFNVCLCLSVRVGVDMEELTYCVLSVGEYRVRLMSEVIVKDVCVSYSGRCHGIEFFYVVW